MRAGSWRAPTALSKIHRLLPVGDVPLVGVPRDIDRVGDQVLDPGVDTGKRLWEIGEQRRRVGKNKILSLDVELLALLLIERMQRLVEQLVDLWIAIVVQVEARPVLLAVPHRLLVGVDVPLEADQERLEVER